MLWFNGLIANLLEWTHTEQNHDLLMKREGIYEKL